MGFLKFLDEAHAAGLAVGVAGDKACSAGTAPSGAARAQAARQQDRDHSGAGDPTAGVTERTPIGSRRYDCLNIDARRDGPRGHRPAHSVRGRRRRKRWASVFARCMRDMRICSGSKDDVGGKDSQTLRRGATASRPRSLSARRRPLLRLRLTPAQSSSPLLIFRKSARTQHQASAGNKVLKFKFKTTGLKHFPHS